MFYGLILTLYLVSFAVLFEKRGFRWQWFLILASAFIAATLLTIPLNLQSPDSAATATPGEKNLETITSIMYVFFCPIHAFITVRVMKAIPKDSNLLSRYLTKGIIYLVAAFIASGLLTAIMFILFFLYQACSG